MNINWNNIDDSIKELSFKDQIITGKVVSVYDGDTIKVVFPLHNVLYKWNCRLIKIDTPELRTKNENEKKYGYFVRDILRDKILNKVLSIKCEDFDKYGRLLVEIFIQDNYHLISINEWLINNKYAFRYDGGTKKDWEEYLVNKDNNMDIIEEPQPEPENTL
jgi:endonuclease YncB( thermonuclease family)